MYKRGAFRGRATTLLSLLHVLCLTVLSVCSHTHVVRGNVGCRAKSGRIMLIVLVSVDNVDVYQCLQMGRVILLVSGSPRDFAKNTYSYQ